MMRLARPLALAIIAVGILVLGAQPAAWATPSQSPAGQTVPRRKTATPTATTTPTAKAQPASTAIPAATATPTATNTPIVAPVSGGLSSFPCTIRPADPDPSTPRVVRQAVDGNTSITLLNCPWSLVIAPGDIGSPGTLEVKLINARASQPANAGERFFGPHVELTLFDTNGQPIANPAFVHPVTLCFNYDANDLAILGDPTQFAIELFNTSTQQWDRLTSILDTANSLVCTTLPHLSLYALAARVPVPGALPRTGAPSDPSLPIWIWALLALGLGFGLSAWARRSQRVAQPAKLSEQQEHERHAQN